MSKIICEICGTKYPETAECCPICGYSQDLSSDLLDEDLLMDEFLEEPQETSKKANFKKREIFDFDEVNSEMLDDMLDEDDYFDDGEEEKKQEGKSSIVLVVILTILIVALLGAAAFIFFRFFLPNMEDEEPVVPTTAAVIITEAPTTEEPTVPCQTLILTSGTAELSQEGQMFLLHVQATPEDTTDVIVYTSADETVATVTDDGRVTAVAEGETVIYITCGEVQITCPVIVSYVEETEPTVETTVETAPEETEPGIRTDVTLKLKQTDFGLGVYYQWQIMLDCDLEQNEVTWRSEHPHIASVDEFGVVTAHQSGTTAIIVTYGDQEVSCIVRCS